MLMHANTQFALKMVMFKQMACCVKNNIYMLINTI